MEISTIIPHIEALIFASEKPLTTLEIVDLVNNALGFIEDRASLDQVESAIEGIREKYNSEFYAFEMRESGGGWQFLTKKDYYKTVALLNGEKFIKRLSNAALETLAIIAYKQPITKSEIETIRGVNCDYAVQKLLEKELVIIAGRNEEAVGKPLIYTTSKSFMDYFGINSADDLPKIREVLMEEMVEATRIEQDEEENSAPVSLNDIETTSFLVNEQGQIIDHSEVSPEEENEEDDETGRDEEDFEGSVNDFVAQSAEMDDLAIEDEVEAEEEDSLEETAAENAQDSDDDAAGKEEETDPSGDEEKPGE